MYRLNLTNISRFSVYISFYNDSCPIITLITLTPLCTVLLSAVNMLQYFQFGAVTLR